MRILEITERTPDLIETLLAVWESSVRATHLFLSDAEIKAIKGYVPQGLTAVPRLIVAEAETGCPVGFLGLSDQKVEMLFVAEGHRGHGIGKALLRYGIEKYDVNDVAVNEENPKARGFYEHMGFTVYKRTDLDEQGNPYPLLYLKRP